MIIGHKKQREFFENKIKNGQLAHAYLFCGQDGIGKKMFALEIANFLNCRFPDLMIVSASRESSFAKASDDKEKVATEIGVEQVRKVQEFLSLKSYNGGYRVVIVDEAEKMSPEAQNCFLKTLEEPKGQTIIFLISSQPDRLLPTIFSRCQVVKFFATKEILKITNTPEKQKKEKEILDNLLKILNGTLAEKFAYTKSIKEDAESSAGQAGQVMEIMQILQKYFREKLLADKAIAKKLNLIDSLIYKLTTSNASPKLALEILLLEI